ncbi:unnamed protein product, partial [Mesorhabditis belari]|uniref:SPARC/Testican calcium-binding domain-containing protein n=1 Tax=Mesorhabditis belari TaxID=2138241 RepID=A0AAF3JBF5_9BILA
MGSIKLGENVQGKAREELGDGLRAKKGNDWDELESLLEDIDEEKHRKSKEQEATKTPITGEENISFLYPDLFRDKSRISADVKSPCEDWCVRMGKGMRLSTRRASLTCECVAKCPELDGDPMGQGGANNRDFRFAVRSVPRAVLVQEKELNNVPSMGDARVEETPGVARSSGRKLLREAESDDEKKHVYPVIWKFCDLDGKPQDKEVSHQELIPITLQSSHGKLHQAVLGGM